MSLTTSLHEVGVVMRVPPREMCLLTVHTTQVVGKKNEKEQTPYISEVEDVQTIAATTKNGYVAYQITMDGSRTDL